MNKTIRLIIKILNWIIVSAAVLLGAAVVIIKLTGIQLYNIKTASMTPDYPVGSLIFVKEIEPDELKTDDVITFWLTRDTTVTHRIIEIVPDEDNPDYLRFRTKGDANEDPDNSLVDQEEVIGTPVITVPRLGGFMEAVKKPPGMYYAMAVAAILILFVFISDIFIGEKKKQNENKIEDKGELKE